MIKLKHEKTKEELYEDLDWILIEASLRLYNVYKKTDKKDIDPKYNLVQQLTKKNPELDDYYKGVTGVGLAHDVYDQILWPILDRKLQERIDASVIKRLIGRINNSDKSPMVIATEKLLKEHLTLRRRIIYRLSNIRDSILKFLTNLRIEIFGDINNDKEDK